MSLIHLEPFDSYSTHNTSIADILDSGPYITAVDPKQDTSPVETGRGALALSPNNSYNQLNISDIGTVIFGFSFYANETLSNQGVNTIISLYYDPGGGDEKQVEFILNNEGSITAKNGDGTILGSSALGTLSTFCWKYIEAKIVFSHTVGTIEIRVNGIPKMELTSQNTVTTASELVSGIRLGKTSLDWNVDNFYVCDTSGSKLNDFLGPINIESLKPIGVGSNTDWTPSTGNNWENVDDDYSGASTANNESSISGDLDSHEMANLTNITNILAVSSFLVGFQPSGSENIQHFILSDNGSNTTSSNVTFNSSDTMSIVIHEDVPGGSDWTTANVNTLEAGYQVG